MAWSEFVLTKDALYWDGHNGNRNDEVRVLQLNVPLDIKYSFVYQKVQSSTGSTLTLL